MTEFAVSTNLISFAPAGEGIFGWPTDVAEAEVVRTMKPGDWVIPKFAQSPSYDRGGGQEPYIRGVCKVLGLDYDEQVKAYNDLVDGGNGAVPFLMRVVEVLPDDDRYPSNAPWAQVAVSVDELANPLTTHEFLRLRVTPVELARQFKATASGGRHIQKVPDGTAAAILQYGQEASLDERALRQLSLVRADTPAEASALLTEAGRDPLPGDRAFLVSDEQMAGVHSVDDDGALVLEGEAIKLRPAELPDLFAQAKARGNKSWRPYNPEEAASRINEFLAGNEGVGEVEYFSHFHDFYVGLARKVNQALKLTAQPLPTTPITEPAETAQETAEGDDGAAIEEEELDALLGLTTASVRKHLPGIALPDSVLAEAVTALRSGKHLLLSGPPGTGKSTVATALCRAVVDEQFKIATATADWTTFDTIGGYLPTSSGQLRFEPGIVLRSLQRGSWLIIDELNRADIDKAFGPLFSLLAGTGDSRPSESIVLPFQAKDGKNISIDWADRRSDGVGPYVLTPSWRLLGTLNVSDKASLFTLSFAFLRRFAVVDVPLPPEPDYADLFRSHIEDVDDPERSALTAAAMALAFGRRQLGPAILLDIANFVSTGVTQTESGSPSYEDPVTAFLTAVRLYAVPQYEGADGGDIEDAQSRLRGVLGNPPEEAWNSLARAFEAVALS